MLYFLGCRIPINHLEMAVGDSLADRVHYNISYSLSRRESNLLGVFIAILSDFLYRFSYALDLLVLMVIRLWIRLSTMARENKSFPPVGLE